MQQHVDKRRASATGVALAGSGAGQFVLSQLIAARMHASTPESSGSGASADWRVASQALCVTALVLLLPAALLLRARATAAASPAAVDTSTVGNGQALAVLGPFCACLAACSLVPLACMCPSCSWGRSSALHRLGCRSVTALGWCQAWGFSTSLAESCWALPQIGSGDCGPSRHHARHHGGVPAVRIMAEQLAAGCGAVWYLFRQLNCDAARAERHARGAEATRGAD